MYTFTRNGFSWTLSNPLWVKLQSNGVQVLCKETEAQGVVLDGVTYHIVGRPVLYAPDVFMSTIGAEVYFVPKAPDFEQAQQEITDKDISLIELGQIATEQELRLIEQGQAITDLELMILEG